MRSTKSRTKSGKAKTGRAKSSRKPDASQLRKTKAEIKRRIKRKYRTSDPHADLYRKKAHEVKFSKGVCPVCGSRIDEKGMCACGAGDS